MSFFEWLAEPFNPGPMGDVDTGAKPLFPDSIKRSWAIFFMILGLSVFLFFIWAIRWYVDEKRFYLILMIVYMVVAYFFTPRPDYSNVGWLGGLLNHPFRISDDVNRWLVLFYILLIPGKLVIFSFQTLYRLLRYN